MRWHGYVTSPFIEGSKVYKCKNNRYRCKESGKYFNVKTGTLFDNTKIPLRKWFMLQRIRKCFNSKNNNHLDGDVEVDETYIGGKNKNRHASKKVKNSQGRSIQDKIPIVGLIQRVILSTITPKNL